MIRNALLATAVMLGLAGCSSSGNTLTDEIVPALGSLLDSPLLGGEEKPAPKEPTRAQLDQVNSAIIAVRIGEDPPSAIIAPVSDVDGYVIYQDNSRRGVVLRGGLVTGTHGLGRNLSAVRHDVADPVVSPQPVALWPRTVNRSYQLWHGSGASRGYDVTVACIYERRGPERIEIFERFFDTERVEEVCGNKVRSFTNVYWVNAPTGIVLQSTQWVGPTLEPLFIQVIKRYVPAR